MQDTWNDADEYQMEAMRTASGMIYGDDIKTGLLVNGVMGLNGEAGECIDIVKKYLFQGHDLDEAHLAIELGDVAWYIAVAAYAINYPLSEVFRLNVEKLRNRYPSGFDSERSQHRATNDE